MYVPVWTGLSGKVHKAILFAVLISYSRSLKTVRPNSDSIQLTSITSDLDAAFYDWGFLRRAIKILAIVAICGVCKLKCRI